MKSIVAGSTKRTIICDCGFKIFGDPVRLELKRKLHNKVCKFKYDGKGIDISKIKVNKREATINYKNSLKGNKGVYINKIDDNNETVITYKNENCNSKTFKREIKNLEN